MNKAHARLAAAAAAGALVLGAATQAVAADDPSRATPHGDLAQVAGYSDADVLRLLLAADGPIATDHPGLKKALGFDAAKEKTDPDQLTTLITAYLKHDKDFHATVALPLQSGEPTAVDEALRSFATDFNAFSKAYASKTAEPSPEAQARGWFWMGANVVIYANAAGAANALVYANAGVATNALATLVVVTWYLEDDAAPSDLDRDDLVKQLSDSLG